MLRAYIHSGVAAKHVLRYPRALFTPTTYQRRQVHPLLVPVLRTGARLVAIFTGRFIRKKLTKLPQDERKRAQRSLWKAVGIVGFLGFGWSSVSYLRHRDRALFTGRVRTISIPDRQMQDMSELTEKEVLSSASGKIFATSSPIHRAIERTVSKLLVANRDLDAVHNIEWKLSVVHSKQANAFVLPNGHIFVYTGMISEMVQNEHQLAFILAHEIAHVLLKHSAEKCSKLEFSVTFNFLATLLLFMGFGDLFAFVLSELSSYLYTLVVEQPYSRLMETEADEVGLMLMARACYDVREACALWKLVTMKVQVENFGGGKEVGTFFSTHPSFESRARHLGARTEEANRVRMGRHCAPLDSPDPVESVEKIRAKLDSLGPVEHGTKLEILKDDVPGRKAIKLYKL